MKNVVLVTGGSGLVGSALHSLCDEFDTYELVFASSKECDFSQFNQTFEYFTQVHPTYVIHLAANVGGLYKNMSQKVQLLETNILINMNVLKASHLLRVKKLIACLSTCIFPDKTTYPINESMLHYGPPHFSNDAYAYAKRLLEIHCRTYQEQYGDNFVCIIPTNIYGPHDNYNIQDGHVIPGLIHKCYKAKLEGKDFVVSGSGRPKRQFIYSEDLARLIMWVLENYHEKSSIILSVGEEQEVTIEYVARLISKYFNYEEKIRFDTSQADGQFKKTADNSKMRKMISFDFTPIEQGIQKSVDWFVSNYETCRK